MPNLRPLCARRRDLLQRSQSIRVFTPGTFQQYLISPAKYVIPIPDDIEPSTAAPLMCGGLSVYTALKRAGLCPGGSVVVCGAGGGLVHLAIQYAKAMSGYVIALDRGSRKQFCLDLGADVFLDFAAFDTPKGLEEEIKQVTNGGANIALMCRSSNAAYSQAMSWLGFRCALACLDIQEKEGCLVPRVIDMVGNELRIIANKTGNRLDARECLEIARQGRIKVQRQIRPMTELTQVAPGQIVSW